MRKILVTAFLFIFSSLTLANTIQVNGVGREYILDAPVNAKAAPLIVALHGGGGSATQLRRTIGLSAQANLAGVVVVYPNGIDKGWNDGRTNRRGKLIRDTDDIGFLTALVNDLVAKNIADPARIVFTGISNGGIMSFKMACDSPLHPFGIAPISANMPEPLNCPNGDSRLLNIVGTEDKFAPMSGGRILRGTIKSSQSSFTTFLQLNKCIGVKQLPLKNSAEDGMTSTMFNGQGCQFSPTTQIVVEGGGHAWAGSPGQLEWLTGTPTMDFSATRMIVNFSLGKPLTN